MKVKTKSGEEINVNFTGSFFESFEGTEEELQKLMNEIIEKVQDGTLTEDSELVDVVDMTEEEIENFGKEKLQ